MQISNMFKTSTENIISKLIASKYPYRYTFYLTRSSVDWNFILKHIDKLNKIQDVFVVIKELGRVEIKINRFNNHTVIIMAGENHRLGADILTELQNYYKDSAKIFTDSNYCAANYNFQGIV